MLAQIPSRTARNNGEVISQTFSDIKKHLGKLSREERFQLFDYIQNYGAFDIIGQLPPTIAKHIFYHFTPRELCAFRLVSKRWNRNVTHDSVWRDRCVEYSMIPNDFRDTITWDSTIPIFFDIFRRSITMIETWKTLSCKKYEFRVHKGPVLSMIMTHATRLFTGDVDGSIHVFDAQNHLHLTTLQAHKANVSCFAYHDNLLAAGSADKEISIHTIYDFKHVIQIKGHNGAVTSVAFSTREKNILFSGSVDKSIRAWDIEKGYCVRILRGQENTITSIIFCPQFPMKYCQSSIEVQSVEENTAGYLISASSAQNIFLWDLKKSTKHGMPQVITSVMETNGPVSAIALYDEQDENNEVYNVANEYVFERRPLGLPTFIAFAGQYDSTVSIFALPGLEKTSVDSPISHQGSIWSISAAPIHSKLITTSGDRTVALWDFKSAKKCVTLGGFDSAVLSSSIPPQEELICVGTENGTIVVLDLQEFA